ncbi:autotransporter domain-containing protein [Pseudochelatococcus sp. G4_1912]|uniref:autotransporter domain-containing protein n=1 Tax=Pseudochelatococcus sp. G4_1912 TaxID=3114288 RepID=UPI0039C70DEC
MTVSKPSRIARYMLLTGVSLLSLSCIVRPSAVLAQVVIDGADETVIGTGGGTKTSPWEVVGGLTVGSSGKGSLSITDGGKVTNTGGVIGSGSGSEGTVTVAGSGSSWESSLSLYVGGGGKGILSITDGGKVTNTTGNIGFAVGSEGTVTVDGAGSSWESSGGLRVGDSGKGSLSITDGGKVTNTWGAIGSAAGSDSTVTVAGSGSSWVNSDTLSVGSSGKGNLSITDGGKVTNTGGYIGDIVGSDGTVTVSGSGSSWENSGQLTVGASGKGILSITDGGKVTNTFGYIGFVVGSEGTVTVAGSGSSWVNSSMLYVSYFGKGSLSITDGGKVTNTTGYIGSGSGSEGTVTVDGAGSSWENSGALSVGSSGKGSLSITDGGKVTNTTGVIGAAAGSDGTVTVAGSGSSWESSSQLSVGNGGKGNLSITDGGKVTNITGVIGFVAGSDSTVTVDGVGSSWVNSGALFVGHLGKGSLSITDGGKVTNTGGVIGNIAGSEGTVTVSGSGSSWVNSSNLRVGSSGAGILSITDGGLVRASGVTIAANSSSIGTLNIGGDELGPAGVAGVLDTASVAFGDGTGALVFNHSGATTFGAAISGASPGSVIRHLSGTTNLTGKGAGFTGEVLVSGGELRVNAGGTLGSGNGVLGDGDGSNGTAVVDGAGSKWALSDGLSVGKNGSGTLAITNGGEVSVTNDVQVAVAGLVSGAINVEGAGSKLVASSSVTVGDSGGGTLRLTAGGFASVVGNVSVASAVGSSGKLIIGDELDGSKGAGTFSAGVLNFGLGDAELIFNHSALDSSPAIFTASMSGGMGTATLKQLSGTTLLKGDSSGFEGDIEISGGKLLVGNASTDKLAGNIYVDSNGTLGGSGEVVGNVRVDGTLSAGNSPGTLTIDGNLELMGSSTSVFELNAPGIVGGAQNDLVRVTGNLTLGGDLNVTVGSGGYYRLFEYGNLEGGSFGGKSITGTGGFVVDVSELQMGIPNQINLVVLGAGQNLQFWDGEDIFGNGIVDGGSALWQTGTTNWTGQPGQAEINGSWMGAGTVAVFAGMAGTVTVDGEQSFDTLQFNVDGYVVTGDQLAIAPASGSAGSINVGSGITALVESALKNGSGTNVLRKVGGGTLELAGVNTYSGGTVVEAGVLRPLAGSTLGAPFSDITVEGGELQIGAGVAVANSQAVVGQGVGANGLVSVSGAGAALLLNTITIGQNGAGAVTVANDGVVSVPSGGVLMAVGAGSSGTLNIGADAASAAAAAGQLDAGTIAFGDGAGSLVFNYTGANTFNTALSGGTSLSGIKHLAGTTTLTANSASFGGTSTLSGGSMIVNGQLGGVLNVGPGGTLAGQGAVATAQVAGNLLGSIGSTFGIDTLTLASTASVGLTVPTGSSATSAPAFKGTTAVLGGAITDVALPTGFSVGDQDASFYVFSYTNRSGEIVVADSVKAAYAGSDFTFGPVEYGYLVLKSKSQQPGGTEHVFNYDTNPNPRLWSGVSHTFVDGTPWIHDKATFEGTATGRPAIPVEGRILLGGLTVTGPGYVFNDYGNPVAPAVFSLAPLDGSDSITFRVASAASADVAIPLAGSNFRKTGDGSLTLSAQSNEYKGTGTLTEGTLNITGDFSQATFVADSGLLRVNGQAGAVTVNANGVLEGQANALPANKVNIASLTVNGGTFQPGNSPGTIRLGSYVQNGGTIAFEPGDLIAVSAGFGGTYDGRAIFSRASDGAPVTLSLMDGRGYTFGNRYVFVTADNGVSFATPDAVQVLEVGRSRLFSQFKAEAVGNVGQFYLERTRSFTDVAWTVNQFAVGRALDATGVDGHSAVSRLYNAIASASNDQAFDVRLAFDQVSGQIHAATQGVLIDESRHLRDALNTRTRVSLDGKGSVAQADRRLSGSGADIGLWGQGYGSWGNAGQLGQGSRLDLSTAGFVLGGDGAVGDNWRLGFAGGYGTSEIRNNALLSQSDVDNYHAAIYGGGRFGALGVQFGVGHTWHSIDVSRQLNVASLGLRDGQYSQYDARTLQVYGEASYTFGVQSVTAEPFVNLAYVAYRGDGIGERDLGLGTGLHGHTSDANTGFSTAGVRLSHTVEVGGVEGRVHGTLGWRYAFGDIRPRAAFVSAQTGAFSIIGTPLAQNALVLGLGGDIGIGTTTRLGVSYSGQMAKNAQDHGVKGYMTVNF